MGRISGLVPSRFLTLLAHLVVVITLFWSRDSNIQACLPLTFTQEEYEKQDIHLFPLFRLVVALSVTLGLFAVELAGFFSGVSMFNSTQSLISIGAHCSASVALSFFIFERWECTTYWYIFVFCSALPAITEMALFVSVFGLKKKPF
ncbi:PREDICTED: transmembrane protein 107 isoform X1 [Odobenus rosmarus divergens]|uniref:Transmembrane protein 107 n=1 Tax=Odobenus rosmarus divergens TaxID=9708 RepID=A0A2U3VT75_ODORO|nr:PREDICTED: transmembrane protein 107 isoform X1 [Odobenus rosmarus divergens]